MQTNRPDIWKEILLGNVLTLEYGKALDAEERVPDGKYPAYGANGVKCRCNKYLSDTPSIIIGRKGSAGEINYSENKFWVLDVAYYVKFDKSKLDIRFLFYLLKNKNLPSLAKGVKPGINRNDVYSIKVKIPPLSEQERIVRILDEVFENIEKAKQNTLKNLNNAKELFESHLNTLLCYFEINGKYKHLSELTTVKDGTHESPKYVKIGIPFITQKNIKDNGLVFITQDTKYISEEDHSKFYQRSNVEQGDILISMIGANRGMACLVDIKNIFSIKNVGLIKFNSNINMKYLLYFLKSKFAKKYIDTKSKGGAQEFISLTSLRNFPILYVDIKDQEYIVQQLDRTKENIQKLEQIYNQKLKSLEELKQTILQKAFNGEL